MNWKQILKTDVTTVFRGFVPPHVYHARRGHRWAGPRYIHRSFWRRDLMLVTSQVQAIVKCNAPLIQGLELAAWDAPRRKVQLVLQALRDNLASGMALHESMAQRNRFFPPYYVDLIKVGEMSGSLPDTLDQLQDHLAEEKKHATKIWGWAAYLALVLFIQLATFLVLSLLVFPEFADTIGYFTDDIPAVLDPMMAVGQATADDRTRIVGSVVGGVFVVAAVLMLISVTFSGMSRYRLKGLGSTIPLVRGVIAKNDLGLAARVLARLLHAGVPLNDALRDSEDLEIVSSLREALRAVRRKVEEGMSLSQAVREDNRFPDSFHALIALGESSGRLAAAFERIAALYEAQTLKTTRILVDTVCPCGVLVLSLGVLFFELSVFTLLTTLADAIGGGV
ncbi:MAG: hypothetical protein AMXMBFR82_04590 [Candidatus Hydrogenedentota bacterium]